MMIWSALHGDMQLPARAGTGVANRLEHKVKRACVAWGIGRELYTAPRIWVPSDKCAIKQSQRGKLVCYDNFVVSKIGIEDGRITGVRIDNTSRGCTCFSWREA